MMNQIFWIVIIFGYLLSFCSAALSAAECSTHPVPDLWDVTLPPNTKIADAMCSRVGDLCFTALKNAGYSSSVKHCLNNLEQTFFDNLPNFLLVFSSPNDLALFGDNCQKFKCENLSTAQRDVLTANCIQNMNLPLQNLSAPQILQINQAALSNLSKVSEIANTVVFTEAESNDLCSKVQSVKDFPTHIISKVTVDGCINAKKLGGVSATKINEISVAEKQKFTPQILDTVTDQILTDGNGVACENLKSIKQFSDLKHATLPSSCLSRLLTPLDGISFNEFLLLHENIRLNVLASAFTPALVAGITGTPETKNQFCGAISSISQLPVSLAALKTVECVNLMKNPFKGVSIVDFLALDTTILKGFSVDSSRSIDINIFDANGQNFCSKITSLNQLCSELLDKVNAACLGAQTTLFANMAPSIIASKANIVSIFTANNAASMPLAVMDPPHQTTFCRHLSNLKQLTTPLLAKVDVDCLTQIAAPFSTMSDAEVLNIGNGILGIMTSQNAASIPTSVLNLANLVSFCSQINSFGQLSDALLLLATMDCYNQIMLKADAKPFAKLMATQFSKLSLNFRNSLTIPMLLQIDPTIVSNADGVEFCKSLPTLKNVSATLLTAIQNAGNCYSNMPTPFSRMSLIEFKALPLWFKHSANSSMLNSFDSTLLTDDTAKTDFCSDLKSMKQLMGTLSLYNILKTPACFNVMADPFFGLNETETERLDSNILQNFTAAKSTSLKEAVLKTVGFCSKLTSLSQLSDSLLATVDATCFTATSSNLLRNLTYAKILLRPNIIRLLKSTNSEFLDVQLLSDSNAPTFCEFLTSLNQLHSALYPQVKLNCLNKIQSPFRGMSATDVAALPSSILTIFTAANAADMPIDVLAQPLFCQTIRSISQLPNSILPLVSRPCYKAITSGAPFENLTVSQFSLLTPTFRESLIPADFDLMPLNMIQGPNSLSFCSQVTLVQLSVNFLNAVNVACLENIADPFRGITLNEFVKLPKVILENFSKLQSLPLASLLGTADHKAKFFARIKSLSQLDNSIIIKIESSQVQNFNHFMFKGVDLVTLKALPAVILDNYKVSHAEHIIATAFEDVDFCRTINNISRLPPQVIRTMAKVCYDEIANKDVQHLKADQIAAIALKKVPITSDFDSTEIVSFLRQSDENCAFVDGIANLPSVIRKNLESKCFSKIDVAKRWQNLTDKDFSELPSTLFNSDFTKDDALKVSIGTWKGFTSKQLQGLPKRDDSIKMGKRERAKNLKELYDKHVCSVLQDPSKSIQFKDSTMTTEVNDVCNELLSSGGLILRDSLVGFVISVLVLLSLL